MRMGNSGHVSNVKPFRCFQQADLPCCSVLTKTPFRSRLVAKLMTLFMPYFLLFFESSDLEKNHYSWKTSYSFYYHPKTKSSLSKIANGSFQSDFSNKLLTSNDWRITSKDNILGRDNWGGRSLSHQSMPGWTLISAPNFFYFPSLKRAVGFWGAGKYLLQFQHIQSIWDFYLSLVH